MRNATGAGIRFSVDRYGMTPTGAYCHVGSGADFIVCEGEDITSGLRGLIDKRELPGAQTAAVRPR